MKTQLYREVERVLEQIPIDFGGGCSVSKAHVMAALIRRYGFQRSLDIGVYRGRSLFPQAVAHRLHTGGVAYGVDPWRAEEAREFDHAPLREAIDRFVETTDFEGIYQRVDALRSELDCQNHCTLVRATSAEAIALFRARQVTFDLIHIDGNHDTRLVMQDVELYQPRLSLNGFIVMDDISWDSVRPAYQALRQSMSLLFERVDAGNDYAVFGNPTLWPGATVRRQTVKWLGRM